MSLSFGFYNSVNGDRVYNADQMSSLFEGIIHDGVFSDVGNALDVSVSTGMNVKVGSGRAWFNNTWTKIDSDIIVPLSAAEVVLSRKDTVVLEIDSSISVRTNSIKVIKGTPASTPVAPTLTNTSTVHQYPLAIITVGPGVTTIVTGNITNMIGTESCPYVAGLLRNVDTETIDAVNDRITEVNGNISDVNSTIEAVNVDIAALKNPVEVALTYYVSTTGSDANDGKTAGTPFRTLTKTASMIRNKEIKSGISIIIAAGNYSDESYFQIASIYGRGNVVISGAGFTTILPYTPVENISITGRVIIQELSIKGNGGVGLYLDTVPMVELYHCSFVTNCGSGAIFLSQYSNIIIEGNTVVSNQYNAIVAERMSNVFVKSASGSGNTKVLVANLGSTIVKNGTMPTGTTAETVATGGVIR